MKRSVIFAMLVSAAFAAEVTLYETWVPSGLTTNWVPVSRWATTQDVAQAIAAIPEPDLSGKVDAVSGNASNLWLAGETVVSDSHTNLWWRNVYSNGWHWLVAYTNAPGGGE